MSQVGILVACTLEMRIFNLATLIASISLNVI